MNFVNLLKLLYLLPCFSYHLFIWCPFPVKRLRSYYSRSHFFSLNSPSPNSTQSSLGKVMSFLSQSQLTLSWAQIVGSSAVCDIRDCPGFRTFFFFCLSSGRTGPPWCYSYIFVFSSSCRFPDLLPGQDLCLLVLSLPVSLHRLVLHSTLHVSSFVPCLTLNYLMNWIFQ